MRSGAYSSTRFDDRHVTLLLSRRPRVLAFIIREGTNDRLCISFEAWSRANSIQFFFSRDRALATMRLGSRSVPSLIRFVCHIPTALIGIWCTTFWDKGVAMPGYYNRLPNSHNILRGILVTGIAGWTIFGWNMIMIIPSTKAQGLALGLIGTVDFVLVCSLVAGILIQAFNMPLTYMACDDDLPGHGFLHWPDGTRSSIFDETTRQNCRAMVRNWAFTITVAVLLLLCALINMRMGFKKAREEASMGQTNATDVKIIENWRRVKGWVGIKDAHRDLTGGASKSDASGEETVDLMSRGKDHDDLELNR